MNNLNGDLSQRVVVDTAGMQWSPSPSGTVWRKRMHRVGPPEAGQVTSVVRYDRDSSFPAHGHPDGEEILVLDGVFSDDRGDWPAGTYLLNPEGYRHTPSSADGCVVFVKLRQFAGRERRQVAIESDTLEWLPGRIDGVECKLLYRQSGFDDSMYLERWAPATDLGPVTYPGGVEFFVLDGAFEDEAGRYAAGTWLRLPLGGSHRPMSRGGCRLYVKYDGLSGLDSGV